MHLTSQTAKQMSLPPFTLSRLSFFRGEAYRAYFEHLDKAGGFFMER